MKSHPMAFDPSAVGAQSIATQGIFLWCNSWENHFSTGDTPEAGYSKISVWKNGETPQFRHLKSATSVSVEGWRNAVVAPQSLLVKISLISQDTLVKLDSAWFSLIQLDSPAADWHVEAVTRTMRSMMVNVYTCEMVNPSIISIANRPPSFSRSAPTTPSWSNRSQDAVPVSGGRSADLRDRCAIVFSHRLVGLLAGECWDRTNNHFKSPS